MSTTLRHLVLGLFVVAAAAAAGVAVSRGLQHLGWAVTAQPLAAQPVPLPLPASPPTAAPVVAEPARAPALHTALLVEGAAHPVDGDQPVALPSGSRFRLRVASGEAAAIEVHAVNAAGQHSGQALWQAVVPAGQPATSPMLRLAGLRGMETLRVQRRTLGDGVVTEHEVRVLHL